MIICNKYASERAEEISALFLCVKSKEKCTLCLKQNQKYLDEVVEVLVEGTSKKDDNMLTGYTRHQKLINFKGNQDHIGQIVPVKVTEVKTWALKGEEIE